MKEFRLYIRNRLESRNSEEGQDLVEYALLLGLIALAAVAMITASGVSVNAIWSAIQTELAAAT